MIGIWECRSDRPMSESEFPEPANLDAEAVHRYFARAHLPAPQLQGKGIEVENLVALVDRYDAFILDGDGVIKVGAGLVPGIADAAGALHAADKTVMILSNTSGSPVHETARRYARMGLGIPEHLVVSSRDAIEAHIAAHPRTGLWGVMATPDSEIDSLALRAELLGDEDSLYRKAEGFILLRSQTWTVERHRRLASALRRRPRPVLVANFDVSAPVPDGSFPAQPGYWAIRLEAETRVRTQGFGKPFAPAFELALARLGNAGLRRDRIAMVGDGLFTDILGGLAAGLGTVLVTDHGLVKDLDWRALTTRIGITPDFVIPGP